MRLSVVLGSLILILLVSPAIRSQYIGVHHVDGLNPDGTMKTGEPVTFFLEIVGDDNTHSLLDNGFRVFSPDGAEWETTVCDVVPGGLPPNMLSNFLYFGVTGSGADTVAFVTYDFVTGGLPAGYDDVAYEIEIGPIDESYAGQTIVLDSSFYPPAGTWIWADVDVIPGWGGPYEYTILPCKSPIALTDPSVIHTTLPLNMNVTVYFGNFCNWDKTAYDVDPATVKIAGVKPKGLQIVPGYGDYFTGPAIRATVSLRQLLRFIKPLTSWVTDVFEVKGKFYDRSQFSMIGDLSVYIYPGTADLSRDGTADQKDVQLLIDYLYQESGSAAADNRYDVDRNGEIDMRDVVELKKLLGKD